MLTLVNQTVYAKMSEELENYGVVQITTCLKQNVNGRTVLILTKPPKVIYKDVGVKLG